MKEITLPIEDDEAIAARQSFDDTHTDITTNIENEEEKEGNVYESFEEAKDEILDKYLRDKNLASQSNKNLPPGYSKCSHHRGRFTSTWVQYSDELGYAYGGADPLNYDPTTKNRFIRKVFTIVLIMLMITSLYNFCSSKMTLRGFYEDENCLFVVVPVAIALIFLNIFMALSPCTRTMPFKHICLFLTLIGTSIVSGYFSGRYNTLLILYTYATTAFVVIAFIIIAMTSYNFIHWTLHIIGVSVAVPFVIAFYMIAKSRIIEHVRPAYLGYVLIIWIVVTFLNVLIVTIMLQIILASQAVDISEDDYTLGAFYLFTSAFDIYIKIVQLLCRIGQDREE